MKRFFVLLFFAGLLLMIGVAILQGSPGYMDADYYYAGAQLLANGKGSLEPYLWNYLNDPLGLPAPSFAYWMPLTSLIAAAGIYLLPFADWWSARIPLIILAALIPPITTVLAQRLGIETRQAKLAGVVALLPGFYLVYLPVTDVFAMEMVLGGLFFILAVSNKINLSRQSILLRSFCLGILAGLMHLARADGILWVFGGLIAIIFTMGHSIPKKIRLRQFVFQSMALLLGYLLLMSPWMFRNLTEWGSLFPPGGASALWLSEYEQTMIFPVNLLTPQSWLVAGWATHFKARIDALGSVLQTFLAVQGEIVLLPFILAGLWILRERAQVRLGLVMGGLFAIVMVLFFPFASVNGSYFHATAALQPLFWAVMPVGLERLALRYADWRKVSHPFEMVNFIKVVILISCLALSGFLYFQRLVGNTSGGLRWNSSDRHYRSVEAELVRLGAKPGEVVLVNNPPGFWLASQRTAVVIPYGGPEMLLAVADRYQVRYLVLEQNNPRQLADLFHNRISLNELEFLSTVGTTQLYRIK